MSNQNEIRKVVREGYANIVKKEESCCGPSSCCDSSVSISESIGYSTAELRSIPEDANLGLGCGNPVALASLKEGEVVLDLGSGAGMDVFLAANRVGDTGKVIGVDMTPDMIAKARENAEEAGYTNVEFRQGIISELPVDDSSVDVVISNCVINLSPAKARVFEETHRVLKSGGRLMVSDIVLTKELPDFIRNSKEAYIGCVSGAVLKDEYLRLIEGAGFTDVSIMSETVFPLDLMANDPSTQRLIRKAEVTPEQIKEYENCVMSIKVSATKP